MELYSIFALLGGSATLILLFKKELVSTFTKNLFSGDKKTVVNTLLAMVFIAAVSSYLGIDWGQPAPENVQEASVPRKSDTEVYAETAIDMVELGVSAINEGVEKREKEKQEYHAKRDERWVYQIGDIASDEDLLYDYYAKLKDSLPAAIFKKSRNEYLLFLNVAGKPGKIELQDSIDNNPDYFNALNTHIKVIDLKAFCDFKNPEVQVDGRVKLKKRGEDRLRANCFVCE
ncbi:hypothetical protein AB9P05_19265 [Roseivirga sp. BDSF3-8]|uniref:hypothetical protein n=1 Tax=Roseivirga sp. BDSF3-8 TaxID=3241598 RepID=UPI00353275FB